MGFFQKALGYVTILAIGSLGCGFIIGYPSPCTPEIEKDYGLSQALSTLFNTLGALIAVVGGLIINRCIKLFKRKLSVFLFGIVEIIGTVLMAVSKKSYWELIFVGRSFHGLTLGGLCGLCAMYITEISPEEEKDSYGVLHQFGITVGLALAYLCGIWVHWRTILWISIAPMVILCILIWIVPTAPSEASETSEETVNAVKTESIFQKKFGFPLLMSFLFIFFQQFSGINAILTNLNTIFSDSGIDLNPSICSFIVGCSQVISTGIASPFVKRVTPKHAWSISAALQFICLFLNWAKEMWSLSPYIPLVTLFVDIFGFGLAFGPVPWYFIPILVPETIRGLVQSLSTAINWGMGSIVIYSWPYIEESWGNAWGYFFFGVICFLAMLFGIFVIKMPSSQVDIDDGSKSPSENQSPSSSVSL